MNTIPERFKTLQLQVDALAAGTNPIVFFPEGTPAMPKLPESMRSLRINKHGWFYYNPKLLSEDLIKESIEKKMMWALLGFVQKKEEALEGKPIAITVRDSNANEVKTAVVDSNNQVLVSLQAYIFGQMFPMYQVEATTVFHVVAERIMEDTNV
jgi:hypothetical protein